MEAFVNREIRAAVELEIGTRFVVRRPFGQRVVGIFLDKPVGLHPALRVSLKGNLASEPEDGLKPIAFFGDPLPAIRRPNRLGPGFPESQKLHILRLSFIKQTNEPIAVLEEILEAVLDVLDLREIGLFGIDEWIHLIGNQPRRPFFKLDILAVTALNQ